MSFSVGAGILERMRTYSDTPASDEVYFPSGPNWHWSEAFDTGGRRYTYIRSSRLILVTDPTSWIDEDELFHPKPPDPPALWPSPERVADILGAPLANVRQNWPIVSAALDELGIGDRPTRIAALATIGVETSAFLPIEEYRNADGSIPDYWYSYDGGPTWHGRGFIQITHLSNYRKYGQRLGVDLEGNPAMALEPKVAAQILATYFLDHGIPAKAAAGDWVGVRKAVNGGTNGLDRFLEIVTALEAL